jgi:hypothetical protein
VTEFQHLTSSIIRVLEKSILLISENEGRIASRKSSFLRFKHLFSSDSVLVSPPRPHLRSSALEQERNMAYVRENEEDVS